MVALVLLVKHSRLKSEMECTLLGYIYQSKSCTLKFSCSYQQIERVGMIMWRRKSFWKRVQKWMPTFYGRKQEVSVKRIRVLFVIGRSPILIHSKILGEKSWSWKNKKIYCSSAHHITVHWLSTFHYSSWSRYSSHKWLFITSYC